MKKVFDYIRSSIRRKMILITTIIIFCVVFPISFFTIEETSRTIKEDVQRYSTQILKQANLNLNRYFEEYEQGFLSMGVSDDFQDWLSVGPDNKADMLIKFDYLETKYIKPFFMRHPEILSVTVLNSNGNEMYYVGSSGLDMLYSLKNELESLMGMPLNSTRIDVNQTDYYRDTKGKVQRKVISMIRPFRGWRDYTIGYIKLDISLEPMDRILGDIYLGEKGYVLVTEADGAVITGTGAGKEMERVDNELLRHFDNQTIGSFFLEGVDDLVMYAEIPYTKWKTVAIVPYEDVAGSILHLRRVTLLVTVGSLIAAAFLIVVFAATITKRLVMLRSSINQVKKGNLSGVVDIKGIDEVADLGQAYNSMLKNLNNTIHDLAEMRVLEQEAVLSALQSQINSHFLYNTLESINSMASLANHKRIESVTIALSNMLRYTSDYKKSMVRIRDEVKHLNNYMEIVQVRYGSSVSYELDADSDCLDAQCLKVIIQPLVENCMKHGWESTGRPIRISVQIKRQNENYIRITIEDNGKGFDPDTLMVLREKLEVIQENCGKFTHIGLLNIQYRLKTYYRDSETGIRISYGESGGARIEMQFPYQLKKTGEQ